MDPQTFEIQVAEPTQTYHNNPNKVKRVAIKVVAGVQKVAAGVVAGVQKVGAGVQNVVVARMQGIVVPVGRAWVAFEQAQAANPPPLGIDFIVTCLIGFVAIKAQGDHGFPFLTHPGLFKISIISILLYGFASLAERLLVPIRLRAVACLGRGVSLGILLLL